MLYQNCISKSHIVSRVPSTHMVGFLKRRICLIEKLMEFLVSVVRVRSTTGRRNRAPPPRVRWKDGKKVNPAVAAAEEAKAAVKAAATS